MANALQEHFAEVLLDRIRSDKYPSGTQMDIFESIAPPRQLAEYAIYLMGLIEDDPNPSIPMIHRLMNLMPRFGS